MRKDGDKIVKIAEIEDEMEGAQLSALLGERGIPHHLRSYHDSAYDGLFQLQLGWGHVEAPSRYRREIESVLKGLREGRLQMPADEEVRN